MRIRDEEIKPNTLVSMDVTRQRFAVFRTDRDARWRGVPAKVMVMDASEIRQIQLRQSHDEAQRRLKEHQERKKKLKK